MRGSITNKRLVFVISVLAILATGATGQQLQSWGATQSLRFQSNPALIDLFDLYTDGNPVDVHLNYRRQWTGYENAPTTILAAVRYSDLHRKMTFGGSVVNDQFGPTDYSEVQLQYAYRLNFDRGENHFLSLGLNFSAMQIRVQAGEFISDRPDDPLLSDQNQSRITPNVGVGLYYLQNVGNSAFGGTFLHGGLSAQQLIPSKVRFDAVGTQSGGLDRVIHLYAFAGVRHYYDRRGYDYVEPFVSAQYALHAPLHYDLGFTMSMARRHFLIGAGLSSTFQLHWQIGLGISDMLALTYSNGFFMGRTIAESTGATHELVLRYRMLTGW